MQKSRFQVQKTFVKMLTIMVIDGCSLPAREARPGNDFLNCCPGNKFVNPMKMQNR